MSAHGDEKDTCLSPPVQNKMSAHDDESFDDTESYPPMPDDIIFELETKPILSRDDPDMEWDHPRPDDIVFELDRPSKQIWSEISLDDTVDADAECSSSKPDDKVVNRNSLLPDKNSWFYFFNSCGSSSLTDEEFPILGSTSSTELTHNRPSFSGSESSSKAPTLEDWVPASTVGSPPGSPSPQVSPTGSPTRPAPSSKRPFSDKIIWGNIHPRGVDQRTGTGFKSPPKTRVLGSGHSDYGYGSVINTTRKVFKEAMQCGDDAFNKGLYKEALQEYDKAVHMKPKDVYLKIVRAETFVCLGRFEEALNEFQEAYMLDPDNGRLHHRLLGVINRAHLHMTKASPECKKDLSAKIAKVKDHLMRGGKARKDDNWIAALREVDAMIAEGADSSQPILVFRAEMLLRMDKLEQAEETMKRAIALESKLPSLNKFLGMPPEAYLCAVYAQIELALGRFENAVTIADRAHRIDQFNDEISAIQTRVRMTCRSRITGNKHYRSGDYLKAREEYKVGLKYAKSNVSLLNNLAACHWQLETWENCIEICNQVLQIRPDNDKALVRRADSYAKLEKWAESVKDYEAAIKIYPGNEKIIEGLKESQAALNKSQVTELAETLLEAEGAVKESQVTELSETLVEAQDAVKVTELAETPVKSQAAVKESQVEDVSED
ncbi:TPR repeat-containing thioredoxin TTL1-like protein [Carex littledalei]|uniref:TPR repeat-containing thioredoxin TTL1-like protein n=1 Tax=Carex littledalei TaxID=544730 RepID=A0A833RQZ8_9POAL|nr:TPR repeat-containing thioredoxin TTL1-like protein [Carex littledalei]